MAGIGGYFHSARWQRLKCSAGRTIAGGVGVRHKRCLPTTAADAPEPHQVYREHHRCPRDKTRPAMTRLHRQSRRAQGQKR